MTYNDSQIDSNFSPNKYHVNTMATFSCDNGYSISGSDSSICQDSGIWDPQTPTCGNEIKSKLCLHENCLVYSTT